MKLKFEFTADTENGEGYFTNGNHRKIEQLIFENPLLAADVLKDWFYKVEELYNQAILEMRKDFDGTKVKQ